MAALVAAIHVFLAALQRRKTWMAGTSPAMTPVASSRLRTHRRPILFVADVLHPRDVSAVERLLHGNMRHGAGRAGAMPVLLARRNPHRVAGPDFADRTAPGLHAAESRHDMEGLAERMGMPRGAGARLKADPCRPDAGRRRRLDDRVLPHRSGKPIARHPARRHRPR